MKKFTTSVALAATLLLGNSTTSKNLNLNLHKIEEKLKTIESEQVFDKTTKEKKEFFSELKVATELFLKNDIVMLEKHLFINSIEQYNEFKKLTDYGYEVFNFGKKVLNIARKNEKISSLKNEIKEIKELTTQIKEKFRELSKKASIINEFNLKFSEIKKDVSDKFAIELKDFWIPTINTIDNSVMLMTELDFELLSDKEFNKLMKVENYINEHYSSKQFAYFTIA